MSVYACSDLHGMYDLWKQVQDFLKEDDTLYFLGDAADRGPDGYKIIKELLADKRVIYLKGNHEKFFQVGISQFLQYENIDYDIWIYNNGGWETYLAAIADRNIEGVLHYIFTLPLIEKYINQNNEICMLSHAGFDPHTTQLTEEDILWDRLHLKHSWPNDEKYKDVYIIHGHTPTPFLTQDLKEYKKSFVKADGAVFYANGHKIDIDCGAFATNATVLLDLDTFETFPIKSANMTEDQAKLLYS